MLCWSLKSNQNKGYSELLLLIEYLVGIVEDSGLFFIQMEN